MIHYPTKQNPQGNHYAVGISSMNNVILLQTQENGNQARIALTLEETDHLINLLSALSVKLKQEQKL